LAIFGSESPRRRRSPCRSDRATDARAVCASERPPPSRARWGDREGHLSTWA